MGQALWARLCFIFAATFVAWPTPWASYWGGSSEGKQGLLGLFAFVWMLLTLFMYGKLRIPKWPNPPSLNRGWLLFADVIAITALLSRT